MDGIWGLILGIMKQPVLLRWVLWPFLAVILNVYWFLWVVRWMFGGPSVPETGTAGSQ